jgi:Leucine-rich repeat (LRR) protein
MDEEGKSGSAASVDRRATGVNRFDQLKHCDQVTEFNVSRNHLKTFEGGTFPKLRNLNVSRNSIPTFEEISNFPPLETLYVSRNCLEVLSHVGALPSL